VRLLLDTPVWLWSLLEPERLAGPVRDALGDAAAELWLSPVSVWELLALIEAGRVVVDAEPDRWVGDALRAVPLREASVGHDVVRRGRRLRLAGGDAADRLIAATALVYDLTLVTAEPRFRAVEALRVLENRDPVRAPAAARPGRGRLPGGDDA
jgi:PIN domain nuclease of toxin-antitoxin system